MARAKKKAAAAPQYPPCDIRRERAELLAGFLRLAKAVLTPKSGAKSVYLTCSQYYCDEAYDAVHDGLVTSKTYTLGSTKQVPWETGWKHLPWDSNFGGIVGFQPMCNEEGWLEGREPDPDEYDFEDGGPTTSSPVAVVHRTPDGLRPHWIARLQRPWLDFPDGMKNREDDFNMEFAPDPPAMPLAGKEKELYADVLAHPDDLGIREVLQDLWMLRGDVRGEFSSLTTAKKLDDKLRARAAEIVLAHGRSWLGPLQPVVPLSGALFGPGPFARKLVVYAADAKAWKKVADAPAWATVESIEFANQSHRALSPAMKNLRAVGPLTVKELAAFAKGTWRVSDLEVEIESATQLAALAKVDLPLTTLRLRVEATPDLKKLAEAAWWDGLRRLEVWHRPSDDPAEAIVRTFEAIAPSLPEDCELAVGKLSAFQRGGWTLAGTAKKRRLALSRPNESLDLGKALAKATRLTQPSDWDPGTDDWFTFGLGVSAQTKPESGKLFDPYKNS